MISFLHVFIKEDNSDIQVNQFCRYGSEIQHNNLS